MNRLTRELAAVIPADDANIASRGPWIEPLNDDEWAEYSAFLFAARNGWVTFTVRDLVVGSLEVIAWQVRKVRA